MRGTYEEGALKHIKDVMQKYEIQVLALQETKQKGNEIVNLDGYTFFNSGGTNRYFGVGFLVSSEINQAVIDWQPLSERACVIRLRGQYRKISIVNVHMPTEEKDLEIKSDSYEELGTIIEKIPKYDIKLIVGDFNAKVGKEEVYRNVTGGKSKHNESNGNGGLLAGFAIEKDFQILSTSFDHKDIHKVTWISPDGKTHNQIDHVLMERKHTRTVTDVRTYRGADADSDHMLVIAKMKLLLPELPKKSSKCLKSFNILRLKNDHVKEGYVNGVNQKLGNCEVGKEIQEEWAQIQAVVTEEAQKWLGSSVQRVKADWYDEDCTKAVEDRNKARLHAYKYESENSKIEYQQKRRIAKQVCRRKKREWMEQKLQVLENYYVSKEVRNFYQEVKKSKNKENKELAYCRDKTGNLIGDTDGKLRRWREHFQELLNDSKQQLDQVALQEEGTSDISEESIEEPATQEILEVIRELKNNKSGGENGIQAEILKESGEIAQSRIVDFIRRVWREGEMPEVWRNAVLCPIPKKGDLSICDNYRGIALLDVTYKVLARVIRKRLNERLKGVIGEYQGGFREGRSTTDQIFTLNQIMKNSREQRLELCMLFIDFKQAYDSVDRCKLYEALLELKVPRKLVQLVAMTLEETQCRVAVKGELSDAFYVGRGLRQGDPLSTVLFNCVLEMVMRKGKIDRSGIIYYSRYQCIAYADDIALVSRSKKELEKVFWRLEAVAKEYGLNINEGKTKYMERKDKESEVQGEFKTSKSGAKTYTFEKVNNFEYLGVTITSTCGEEEEITKRVVKGNRALGMMTSMLTSKAISRASKLKVYRTVIRPAVLYGSELWVLSKNSAQKLEIWERKVLRRIYGGIKISDGLWRRRTNKEVQELYEHPTITQTVRAQRARWLGHLARMEGTRNAKRALLGGDGGKKGRGRPKRRWLDAVKEDLRGQGVEYWTEAARNRKSWKEVVRRIEST